MLKYMSIENVVVSLISILFTCLIFYLGFTARKPMLIISGNGGRSGGQNSVHTENISIMNDPKFFGMRIDRETARITYVHIKDKKDKTNYYLSGNWFGGKPDTQSEISIQAGEVKALNLFVFNEGGDGYYVCGQNYQEIGEGISPCFTDSRKQFELFIRDKISREYRFDILVEIRKQNMRQEMIIRQVITLSDRLQMVRNGFSSIIHAFKPSKFH